VPWVTVDYEPYGSALLVRRTHDAGACYGKGRQRILRSAVQSDTVYGAVQFKDSEFAALEGRSDGMAANGA
jgi:hypothetical protein